MDKHLVETRIDGELVYDGHFLKIQRDNIALPDGQPAQREYVLHPGAVVILPLLDDGTVLSQAEFYGSRYFGSQFLTAGDSGGVLNGGAGDDTLIGGALAMSSTAIVLRQLGDQQELARTHARLALGILLFQDLMVAPILITIAVIGPRGIYDLQCWQDGGRKNCAKDPVYRKIESDMHNLQPAVGGCRAGVGHLQRQVRALGFLDPPLRDGEALGRARADGHASQVELELANARAAAAGGQRALALRPAGQAARRAVAGGRQQASRRQARRHQRRQQRRRSHDLTRACRSCR